MKVLLTGKGGQLGSLMGALLADRSIEVVGLDSRALDITDPDRVRDVVDSIRPAVVINCAAYTMVDRAESDSDRAFAVNSKGAGDLAAAAANSGAKVVHISTDYVFDGRKGTPYVETDQTNPLSVYGRSKLEGERAVAEAAPGHVIIRTSWLYGSTGHNFVKTILRLASERETLSVVYDQAGTPTPAVDLASVLDLVVRRIGDGTMEYGLYHYSDEGVASWYDFAVAIVEEAASMGARLRCREVVPVLTAPDPAKARRPAYSVLSKEKIKAALGITIPHWRVSLRKAITTLVGEKNA